MELDRRAHAYVNDIDPSRTHLNLNYRVRAEDAHPLPLELAVERRMGELNVKRKVRDNQVRAMGFIVSTNDALDDEQAHAFLNESLCWFADRYGWENLLAAAEHYDPPPCVHCPLSKSAAAQGSLRGREAPSCTRRRVHGKDESAARFGRAAECPSVSRGHERRGVKGTALARPNAVWYTVTIPKGVAPALMVPSWEVFRWQLPL